MDVAGLQYRKSLTGLSNGIGLAFTFNTNILSNVLALRFGLLHKGSDQIWKKTIENKSHSETLKRNRKELEKSKEHDIQRQHLFDLLQEAEQALTVLNGIRGHITLSVNPEVLLTPKVSLEVFLKSVKKMAHSDPQKRLVKCLDSATRTLTALYELSKDFCVVPRHIKIANKNFTDQTYYLRDTVDFLRKEIGENAIQKLRMQKKVQQRLQYEDTIDSTGAVCIPNIAQHDVNQKVMKMRQTRLKLEEAKEDCETWQLHVNQVMSYSLVVMTISN